MAFNSPVGGEFTPTTPPRAAVPGITTPAQATAPAGAAGSTMPTTPYDSLFERAESTYGIPRNLVKSLAYEESRFNPTAKNPTSSATGIMQYVDKTARDTGIDPLNVEQSIMQAAKDMRQHFDRFGDWSHAVAAHHNGPGDVAAYLSGNESKYGIPAQYVRNIVARANAGAPADAPAPAAQPAAAPALQNGGFPVPPLPGQAPATAAQPAPARAADIGYNPESGQVYVNGNTFDSKDYGKAIELYRGGAFTSPGKGQLPQGFRPTSPGEVEGYFEQIVPSSSTGKAVSAGVANYKAGFSDIAGAARQMIGTPPEANTSMQRAGQLQNYAGQLGGLSDLPQSWDDVKGLGGAAAYTYDKILGSLPYMVEGISTGLAGAGVRAAMTQGAKLAAGIAAKGALEAAARAGASTEAAMLAAENAAKQTFAQSVPFALRNAPEVAMLVGTYPSAMGDVLGNQREQAGVYAPGAAAAVAAPYAALNLMGGGPQAVRALTGESLHGAINAGRGVGGRLARGATVGLTTGAEEAIGESGQEVMNQLGRMTVDPSASLTSPEALARYKESGIAGGAIGAVMGGVSGAATRGRAGAQQDLMQQNADDTAGTPPTQDNFTPPTQDLSARAPVNFQPSQGLGPAFPVGNIDLREDKSPFTGIRAPLTTENMPGTGAVDLLTGSIARRSPAQAPQSNTGGLQANLVSGDAQPTGVNALGEQFDQPVSRLDVAGAPQPQATALSTPLQDSLVGQSTPADVATAKPRQSTATVTRLAPRRFRLPAAEESTNAGSSFNPTGTATAGLSARPAESTGSITGQPEGSVVLKAGKGRGVKLDTAKKSRADQLRERAAKKAEAAQAAPAPTAPTDQSVAAESDAELARLDKELTAAFGMAHTRHSAPKEPSAREVRRAQANPAAAQALSEEVATNGELTSNVQRYRQLSAQLRGFSRYASQSKKPGMAKERAESKGKLDRIAAHARERGRVRTEIVKEFERLVKKHGVAGVDAMFQLRKKSNTEAGLAATEHSGEADVRVGLSNLWRLYREGHFASGVYGFTNIKSDARIRSRFEEGATANNLKAWFGGERQTMQGGGINGMLALAYYMRHHARTDLEGLLGGRIYHVFKETKPDFDLKIGKGQIALGKSLAAAAFVMPRTKVAIGEEMFTATKPTLVFNEDAVTEEMFVHEMTHAATVWAIMREPGMRDRFKPIIDAVNKTTSTDPALQAILDVLKSSDPNVAVAELVAYGFTSSKFQEHLKSIKMDPPKGGRVSFAIRNAFEFFVNLVKLAVGAHGAKYSAMQRFVEEGGRLFDVAEKTKPKGKAISVGANSIFKAAAFRHATHGEVVESGAIHDRNKLSDEQKAEPIGNWQAGFVDHSGKFYTRDQAHAKLEGVGGELHSSDVWERDEHGKPIMEPTSLAMADTAEHVPHGNILNPVTAVEKAFKSVIQAIAPWWREDAKGKTAFESWATEHGDALRNHIIENHPRIARFAANVIDKFAVPSTFRGLLDMGRKIVHNAGQTAFSTWESIKGFTPAEQEALHEYLASGGTMDISKLPAERQNLLNNVNKDLSKILDRAREQGVLPKGLEKANITEFIRWIDGNTAKMSFGLKSQGISLRPKGEAESAHKATVLGDADAYHRGLVSPADGSAPYYVFVPQGAVLSTVEKDYGQKIDLDTERTWRMVGETSNTRQMWSAYTFKEGMKIQKAAEYSDALVMSVHRILHDTAVNEFANSVLDASEEHVQKGEDALIYKSREALVEELGGEGKIIDKLDNPERKLLARTPGFWVKLGKGYGNLSEHYVPATVYSAITDAHSADAFFPEFKTILNFWKKTKTAYSIPTHFNNVMSSFVMAYMNDIPVATIRDALRVHLNRKDGGANEKLWDQFSKSGALIASYATGEFGSQLEQKLNKLVAEQHGMRDNAAGLMRFLHKFEQLKATQAVVKTKGAIDNFAVGMYEAEDNVFRLAAFMEHLRRQDAHGEELDYATAGKFAADAMINYSIDAKYVNNLRKTVMPFLAWPYRMVPMLIKTALFKPWKIATMWAGIYGLNALAYAITGDDEDEERKSLPEYMRGNLFLMPAPKAVRMPFAVDGKPVFWNISNFMPLGDFLQESRTGLLGLPWPQGLMPGGPLVVAAELSFGYNSFTGQPISQPTATAGEKAGNSLQYAWNAFSPNIPLPLNQQGGKVYDILREKHGITGSELDWGTTILQMVGPKIVPIDLAERHAQAGRQIAGIVHEYRQGIAKVAREEMRYANPDMDKIHEKQADLIAEMLKKIQKAKGEENGS